MFLFCGYHIDRMVLLILACHTCNTLQYNQLFLVDNGRTGCHQVHGDKSRFYAHLYSIDSPDDIDAILKEHRKMYKKANHHCWALSFRGTTNSKDDGEVGHPGKALLEILNKHDLDSHVIVVSRIFGGVKLGVGGVTRAFRTAGEGLVEHYKGG